MADKALIYAFFSPEARPGLDAYRFVLGDTDFAKAFATSFALASSMTAAR